MKNKNITFAGKRTFDPNSEDIAEATKEFLGNGGEIKRINRLAYADFPMQMAMYTRDFGITANVRSKHFFGIIKGDEWR